MGRKKTKTQQAKLAARRLVEDARDNGPKVAAAAAAAVAGGAAYAVKRKRSNGNEPEYEGQTVAAPPMPFPDAPMPVA